jgi:hypothetical protein
VFGMKKTKLVPGVTMRMTLATVMKVTEIIRAATLNVHQLDTCHSIQSTTWMNAHGTILLKIPLS